MGYKWIYTHSYRGPISQLLGVVAMVLDMLFLLGIATLDIYHHFSEAAHVRSRRDSSRYFMGDGI